MRSVVLSALCLSIILPACEDGPTQVYTAPPDGAATRWNNGGNPGYSADGGQGFTNVSGGNNLQQICTGSQRHDRWAVMVTQPIVPPRMAAGLDLAGGDTWVGLTIEQAEQINCQSTNDGDQFGDGALVNQWGDNGEVWAEYSIATRKIDQLTMFNGYRGALTFTSPDGMHNYSVAIGSQVTRDGAPLTLDWVDASGQPAFDELYRGMMHTYSPALPIDPVGTSCVQSGHCVRGSFGDVAYFYIQALGMAIWIDNQNAPQPTPSIPTRIDLSPAKVLPFAFANSLLALSSTGPTSSAGNLGVRTTPCTLQLGENYGDFLHQCVQVTDTATEDMTELNKLIGGISHDTQSFTFNTAGVDIEFADGRLGPMSVVNDADRPAATDTAVEFILDQSTLGNISNDYDASGNLDLHGTAAVWREYARIVRATLLADAGIPDGDVTQCLFPSPLPAGFDPNAFVASLPPYCTGFEGIILPSPQSGPTDVNDVGIDAALAIAPGMAIGLKPGHQGIGFCWDANGDLSSGYTQCTSGDTFPTSYARVLSVFGRGSVSNLPFDARDVRFFFKAWSQALIKHFLAPTQADLSTVVINYDDLFFDAVGAGQFEIMEYVDRRFASQTQGPLDLRITADVRNGIFNDYDFTRFLYRGESALYSSVLENQSDGLGQEDSAVLTNIFGSPVLQGGWHDASSGQSAYHCATHLDPSNCDGQVPPLDGLGNMLLNENGQPILAPYPGAFSGTAFSLGPTSVRVTSTFPSTEEAMITVPLFSNPYYSTSTALTPLTTLVPWLPKQPGVGFPIALTGTLDRFVETYQMDLSGTTISANIDYDVAIDPNTQMPATDGSIQLLAVETTDFLGEIFVCQDGATGDLLHVRMYSNVASILDWLTSHPGSTDACGIVIRYSPYNNYVDYITSQTNGVRLGITQGGGFGRVVDVTLFVPGQ